MPWKERHVRVRNQGSSQNVDNAYRCTGLFTDTASWSSVASKVTDEAYIQKA